jgi:1-acyl-sn-glycerol-3-phosphate acyltransferase
VSKEVRERVDQLELPFNKHGLDPFGLSKDSLATFYTFLGRMYRGYFKVRTVGIEHVPVRGRALLIGNHSGSLPADGGMVLASIFFEMNPPRHMHGMVEKFAQYWPFVSTFFMRVGQMPGLPENAIRFLEDDRMLMVFPEGARGTGKLYKDRYQLVRFGTGFMRIALQTGTPIVPFAFVGGEEAFPAVYHSKFLARLIGAPYWPVPPYIIPIPRPYPCELLYGEPMVFEGSGGEADEVVIDYVNEVKARINGLIELGREANAARLAGENAA